MQTTTTKTDAAPPSGRRLMALEADLDWYFGEGSATFERSTFGSQLEHAELFALATRPCFDCGGIPASNFGGEVGGTGFTESGSECRRCRGLGWVVCDQRPSGPLTAKPKPEHRAESGYWPGHDTLVLYATMSRVIKAVAEASSLLACTLRAYYGDQGARWGLTKNGRIFAVYPLTKAGQRLLEVSRRRSESRDTVLRDDEVLGVEQELQRAQPNDMRRLLLDKADREARVLHADALHAADVVLQ